MRDRERWTMFLLRYVLIGAAFFTLSATGAMAVDSTAPAPAAAPIRHLEYHFTVGIRSDTTTHDSGIANPGSSADSGGGPSGPAVSASGINELRAGSSDEGTILVDVLAIGADSGVVLNISEKGRGSHNAEAAQCVAYGNTYFICDQSKKVYDEEIAVIRYLGRSFTFAVPLDSKNHWQFRQSAPTMDELSDFTIKNNAKGIVEIEVERQLKITGAGGYDAATNGKITYDRGLSVPIAITEQTITRADQGAGAHTHGDQIVDLKLVSDSKASAGTHS